MVKMIFSFAAVMVLSALMLAATPAQAFDSDVTLDGVEQVEGVDCEAAAPTLDEATTAAQVKAVDMASVTRSGIAPAQRVVIVESWQMPHKPRSVGDQTERVASRLQPCLSRRTGFILSSPVEHRIRQRPGERMGESTNGHRHRSNHRLS